MATRKRILVAPLDWGLGHATRCIPIINNLVENGCEVVIAGDGNSLLLLQNRYPTLQTVQLPGYDIKYSRTSSQVLSMLMQVPKLLRVIAAEHALLNDLVKREHFDGIISDNRYGFYSDAVPSIIITHELRIMMPRGLKIFQTPVKKLLHNYINRFDECWVPDASGDINLSGELSHNVSLKIPLHYIGPLSRLKNVEQKNNDYDLLVLLSGPEPQRTLLEEKVVKQLLNTDLKVMLVQGLPKNKNSESFRNGFDVTAFADENGLVDLLSRSKYVFARSGYSSVMDLCRVGAKAILIPTPGQTEQQHLAENLSQTGWCVTSSQNKLDIIASLEKLKSIKGFENKFDFDLHRKTISEWLQTI